LKKKRYHRIKGDERGRSEELEKYHEKMYGGKGCLEGMFIILEEGGRGGQIRNSEDKSCGATEQIRKGGRDGEKGEEDGSSSEKNKGSGGASEYGTGIRLLKEETKGYTVLTIRAREDKDSEAGITQ